MKVFVVIDEATCLPEGVFLDFDSAMAYVDKVQETDNLYDEELDTGESGTLVVHTASLFGEGAIVKDDLDIMEVN